MADSVSFLLWSWAFEPGLRTQHQQQSAGDRTQHWAPWSCQVSCFSNIPFTPFLERFSFRSFQNRFLYISLKCGKTSSWFPCIAQWGSHRPSKLVASTKKDVFFQRRVNRLILFGGRRDHETSRESLWRVLDAAHAVTAVNWGLLWHLQLRCRCCSGHALNEL